MSLDEVNRKLISHLQVNGRATFEQLGKLIGYTSMGIKKRYDKLLKANLIKVSTLLNAKALNLHPALVLLEMESAEAMHILLDRFQDCPRVVNIFTTLGGYNIIALIVAEDRDTLESISIEKCSLRSGGGIRRSEFIPIGDVHYSGFLPIREFLTHKDKTITPCGVDCRPCQRYQMRSCGGCPTTQYYNGSL
jgi:Lrp/AsnC family leucine-responsive transcriptional regulator